MQFCIKHYCGRVYFVCVLDTSPKVVIHIFFLAMNFLCFFAIDNACLVRL